MKTTYSIPDRTVTGTSFFTFTFFFDLPEFESCPRLFIFQQHNELSWLTSCQFRKMFRRRQQVSDPSIKLDPFWVVRNGNSDQLVKCIEQGLNVSKVRCGSGWTLLHRAAEQGYSEICEILIQNGCDVNSQSICKLYLFW